jgi:hypothetical protein
MPRPCPEVLGGSYQITSRKRKQSAAGSQLEACAADGLGNDRFPGTIKTFGDQFGINVVDISN